MIAEARTDILLVEDNESDVTLVLRALAAHDLAERVFVVRDGADALAFLFRTGRFADREPGDPRVVLLDLKLPKVNGIEVLHQMKGDPRTHAIPVVVATSSGEPRDLRETYALGVNSYIQKPIVFESLMQVLGAAGTYWLDINRVPE